MDVEQDFAVFVSMLEERGPSVRAFQTARGLSNPSVAEYHLRALVAAGLIERVNNSESEAHPYRLTARGKVLRDTLHAVLERVS